MGFACSWRTRSASPLQNPSHPRFFKSLLWPLGSMSSDAKGYRRGVAPPCPPHYLCSSAPSTAVDFSLFPFLLSFLFIHLSLLAQWTSLIPGCFPNIPLLPMPLSCLTRGLAFAYGFPCYREVRKSLPKTERRSNVRLRQASPPAGKGTRYTQEASEEGSAPGKAPC